MPYIVIPKPKHYTTDPLCALEDDINALAVRVILRLNGTIDDMMPEDLRLVRAILEKLAGKVLTGAEITKICMETIHSDSFEVTVRSKWNFHIVELIETITEAFPLTFYGALMALDEYGLEVREPETIFVALL